MEQRQTNDLSPLFTAPADIIAGPCSAETEEQTLSTARGIAAAGVRIFRAGIWKPRTKPGGFEGAGAQALAWLRRVKRETGMLVATEIATPAHLRLVAKAGLDAVWIGARTTANPFAMQEIADTFASLPESTRDSLAVLVKNPVNPDIELWIGAMERLLGAGVRRIGAIHRGFSSYGEHYYRNAPMWRIPIELHRRWPSLPVYCDPSHIGGRRELIAPLCQQAIDMEFCGLMIESHCDPDNALSDSRQQITPAELERLLHTLARRSAHYNEALNDCRRRIDIIDDELMELLARRMAVAREIGRFKQERGMAVVQPERYRSLIERRVSEAERLQMDENFIRSILEAIHEESVRQQLGLE